VASTNVRLDMPAASGEVGVNVIKWLDFRVRFQDERVKCKQHRIFSPEPRFAADSGLQRA